MGCCNSRSYEQMTLDPAPVNTKPSAYYFRRQPKPNEIEELAESLSLETFQKYRAYMLKKIDDVELDNSKALLLMRSLKLDNEKVDFIRLYSCNFKDVNKEDLRLTFRNPKKFEEAVRYMNTAV
ncbi:hypothetical protein TVAG_488680 [Trichomonas vaginalis G3]|uniref:Uncharacterized protein n=1 Tax=Trichomonas vaginalis (strain ATCC PRA-98 / G3) TaxID=412133 RepID=A2FXF1_TRIV3|nr:hypothetical protein TVAGG3_0432380 [Trichomonas vaginalis G3]EAX90414.1 hypothetical protein TVAG_488680 [Trichomonas vaginalis G3]KAI5536848.1 hypothetical protein TVAGG3_0432380 [Trichomonas vaginalis G3]|eukprot:XP_001303344.1 hypothetical protein [Trichomonas vaginalis G3]